MPVEARPLAAPSAVVMLSIPGDVQLGQAFSFTATFDNTDAVDEGYGPFIDLTFPVTGTDGAQGWNLTWLGDQAGYLEGTAYPTHAGNSSITAHAYLPDGLPGPFVNLGKLTYGDRIVVHLGTQLYYFEVRENRRVGPNTLSVLKHEDYPWLTLITCQDYSEALDDYRYRIAVRAVLVKIESEDSR